MLMHTPKSRNKRRLETTTASQNTNTHKDAHARLRWSGRLYGAFVFRNSSLCLCPHSRIMPPSRTLASWALPFLSLSLSFIHSFIHSFFLSFFHSFIHSFVPVSQVLSLIHLNLFEFSNLCPQDLLSISLPCVDARTLKRIRRAAPNRVHPGRAFAASPNSDSYLSGRLTCHHQRHRHRCRPRSPRPHQHHRRREEWVWC